MATNDLTDAERALAAGDLARGERLVRRILAVSPDSARANELMAYVLACRGDSAGTVQHLRKATRRNGASAAGWYQLGVALRDQRALEEARDAFEHAIERDPRFFPAHHELGVVLHDLRLGEESLAALDRAASIEPLSFEVFHNRGRTLHFLRRHEDAVDSYCKALALRPEYAPTYLNRGEALADLRRYPEALADYRKALDLRPDYDDARWNEALARLLLGEFDAGWKLYECRWRGTMAWPRRHTDIPPWLGAEDVRGKRLLVWWEQGFGDTIHFCRYLPMLVARGAEVVFEVQPTLVRLMESLGAGIKVVASGHDIGRCDFQVPLLSLPLVFGTRLETIPANVPYLAADPDGVRQWSERLKLGGALNIAVTCSGHSAQKDDKARSMHLRALAPLAEIAEIFVVQVEVSADDREFALRPGSRMHLLDDKINGFEDSAAILANMDAVVSIDTAVAHLAGALAKRTWIMLPWTPTWRWMVDRQDSPWYPTARLVRQRDKNRWDDVVSRVREELV